MIYFTIIVCMFLGALLTTGLTLLGIAYKEHLERMRTQKSLEGLLSGLKEEIDMQDAEDEYLDNLLDIKKNKSDTDIH